MFARVATILVALAGICTVGAQTDAVRPMMLRECIELALENNLSVQIERYGPRIARLNLETFSSVYIPAFEASAIQSSNTREGGLNPVTGQPFPSSTTESTSVEAGIVGVLPLGLRYDFTPNVIHRTGTSRGDPFDFYEGQAGITMRQPLLRDFLIDQPRQNILVARKLVQISEYGLAEQIMAVINSVEQAYFDLVFAFENIKVQQAGVELAERLAAENRRRVEVGTLAPLEEAQAEAELALRRADLVEARQRYLITQNVLKSLITDDYAQWHGIEITPAEKLLAIRESFDVIESWRYAMANRPDLQQRRLDLERRDIVLRYRRNQIFPAVDLVGSYGNNGLDDDAVSGVLEDFARSRNPFYSFGVVFSVPLSNKGPRSAYQASKAEKERALLAYKQQEQIVMVQVDDAIKTARMSLERIEATRKAREFAEAALDAEQKKLEAGRSTSFVVLELQRELIRARFQEIRALADYNRALAELAFRQGSNLERNGFGISVK